MGIQPTTYNEALSAEDIRDMETISLKTEGCAAVPIDIDNQEVLEPILQQCIDNSYPRADSKARSRIYLAAIATYEASTQRKIQFSGMVARPNGEDMEFDPGLQDLVKHLQNNHLALANINPRMAAYLIQKRASEIWRSILNEELYYSPYYYRGKQIDITDYVQSKLAEVYDIGERFVLPAARKAVISVPFVRGYLIPSGIPGNKKPGDHDSGNCYDIANTSFSFGEEVWVVARNEEGWFFVVSNRRSGWINEDAVWADDIPSERFRTALPSAMPSHPQEFLNTLYARTPYMYSLNDCSEHFRKAMGLSILPKHSKDACWYLRQHLPEYIIGNPEALDWFKQKHPGIYVAQMRNINTNSSMHIEIVTIPTDPSTDLEAFSLAFMIRDSDGNLVYPVGSVVRDHKALAKQLQNPNIEFRFYRIAKPVTRK